MSRNYSSDTNAMLSRLDSLERALQHLQGNVTQLQALLSTSARSSPTHVAAMMCNKTTQTEPSRVSAPMDLDNLNHKVSECQNEDRNISMLKYFLEHDIKPKTKEIADFEPQMRRLLWQYQRFFLKDGKLFRKRMASDRITEHHQFVVPANMIPDVLNTFHPLDNHTTLECSISTISEHFFWPSMKRDTTQFARTCSACQLAQSHESSAKLDQMPASAIRTAVCAITELTKDFIRRTDPPRSLRQKRHRKNRHNNNNNFRKPPADLQPPRSPPRDYQPQSPENPWKDLSHMRSYFAHPDHDTSSSPRDYHHSRSTRTRDYRHYHSPPRYRDYSPSRELYPENYTINSPDRWRDSYINPPDRFRDSSSRYTYQHSSHEHFPV